MHDPSADVTRKYDGPATAARIPTPGSLPSGTRVGAYVIEERIARGGSASVYRAMDEMLGRRVALKVLDSDTAEWGPRFLREVQLVAGLVDPHIVGLYTAGDVNGITFAAMELMFGSLGDEIASRGRLPWDEALRAARDACLGLDAAWKRGIVHRDIKPSNLLRDGDGVIKVADFGLAKDVSSELELTSPGVVIGTPMYVSPEQGCGRATDLRSDLYSLGATLFHLIAGRPPYDASTSFELIVRHAVEPTPALRDVPPEVSAFVQRLMEKTPEARPQTYDEALALIARALDLVGAGLTPTPAPRASHGGGDALAISELAAARAALDLGRHTRARDMLDRLYRDRGSLWMDAGLDLATVLQRSGDLAGARTVLETVSREAPDANTRALALWTLGALAEQESAAALTRAADAYARVLEVSDTLFPKTLLEARINKLRAKAAGGGGS